MRIIDLLINTINPETEIRMIWKLKRKSISKLKYNRNGKEHVTHKTVTEIKLIFETEISLVIKSHHFLLVPDELELEIDQLRWVMSSLVIGKWARCWAAVQIKKMGTFGLFFVTVLHIW